MLDENWKRKLEEITRKNREKEKEAFRKAEKIRREGEDFWRKKALTHREGKEDSSPAKVENLLSVQTSKEERHFLPAKTEEKKLKFILPNLKKPKNLPISVNKTQQENV